MLYQPSREQARRFFIDAWRKHRGGRPLEPLEALAVDQILLHPEYHAILEEGEANLDRDWLPGLGQTNPFLHLSLHLSIAEQLSIDQPPGIASHYAALLRRLADAHAAQHALMECLVETLWRAQRDCSPPDAAAYLACLRARSTGT